MKLHIFHTANELMSGGTYHSLSSILVSSFLLLSVFSLKGSKTNFNEFFYLPVFLKLHIFVYLSFSRYVDTDVNVS